MTKYTKCYDCKKKIPRHDDEGFNQRCDDCWNLKEAREKLENVFMHFSLGVVICFGIMFISAGVIDTTNFLLLNNWELLLCFALAFYLVFEFCVIKLYCFKKFKDFLSTNIFLAFISVLLAFNINTLVNVIIFYGEAGIMVLSKILLAALILGSVLFLKWLVFKLFVKKRFEQ